MTLHGRPPTMERTAAERKGVTVELGRTPAAARAGNAGAPTTWNACRSSRRAGGRAGGPYGRLSEHIVPHPLHHESDEVVLEAEAAVVALACACRSVSAGRRAPRCECTSRTAGSLAHRRAPMVRRRYVGELHARSRAVGSGCGGCGESMHVEGSKCPSKAAASSTAEENLLLGCADPLAHVKLLNLQACLAHICRSERKTAQGPTPRGRCASGRFCGRAHTAKHSHHAQRDVLRERWGFAHVLVERAWVPADPIPAANERKGRWRQRRQ